MGRTVPRRRPGQGGCVAARGRRPGMNRSPVSRQAVATRNCGESGNSNRHHAPVAKTIGLSASPAPPLTLLPPPAVGAILLAEGYASLAAGWHLVSMPPETLEEGLEACAEIAAQLAGRSGSGRVDQDDPFCRRRRWRQTRLGGPAGCCRLRGIAAVWERSRSRAPSQAAASGIDSAELRTQCTPSHC